MARKNLSYFKLILENRISQLKDIKKECDWMDYDWQQYGAAIDEAEYILELLEDCAK